MISLDLAKSALLALVGFVVAATAQAGYFYEAVNTNEAAGMPGGSQVSTVYAWVDGDNAKIEFQDAAQAGLFQAGSYIVTTDAGDTLYLIDPEKMTMTMIDFDQIMGMAGSMMEAMSGVVNMEFGDFSSEKISEEPGGRYPRLRDDAVSLSNRLHDVHLRHGLWPREPNRYG